MEEMSLPLQMMPGGMMPSGWDWGSMWLMMLLPAIAVGATVVLIAVLFLRQNHSHPPLQSVGSPLSPQGSSPVVSVILSQDQPNNEALGRVVRFLAPTLMDDERRVMDEVVRAGGEVLQSDLPGVTDLSKATVSKVIHSLEVRGIIVREKHRWTFWCKVNPRLVERFGQQEPTPLKPTSP